MGHTDTEHWGMADATCPEDAKPAVCKPAAMAATLWCSMGGAA